MRGGPGSSQNWTLRATVAAALLLAVAWGGATRPPATIALALVGALALGFALAGAARGGRALQSAPIALPILAMAIGCVIQLAPLPPSLHGWLSPVAARSAGDVLHGLAAPGGWRPITCDVAATVEQTARLFGLAALAIAFATLAGERDRRWLRGALGAALTLALAVPVLATIGIPLPAALVPITTTRALVPFSFANPNHAATFFALLLPSVIAQAARREGRERTVLAALAVAGNLGLAATLSRAGIAVGIAAQLYVLWRVLRPRDGEKRSPALVAIALAAIALAAVPLAARWRTPHALVASIRFRAWHDALAMVRDHFIVGAGRGAFVFVFPRYNGAAGSHRFAFIENEYLQLLLDYGVVLGALVVGAAMVALRRARAAVRAEDSPSLARSAAGIGVVAAALHNGFDFSFESGAVAAATCALAALALPASARTGRALFGWGVIAATVTASAVSLFSSAGRDAEEDVAALRAGMRDRLPVRELSDREEAAWRRHPFDGLIADLAAQRRFGLGDPTAVDWLDRALADGPHDVAAHHLAARALAVAGDLDLAGQQLRVALGDAGDRDRGALLLSSVTLFPDDQGGEKLLAALPPRADVLRAVQQMLIDRQRYRAAERIGSAAVAMAPDDATIYRAWVASGAALHLPDARRRVLRLVQLDPSPATIVLGANALAESDPAGAEQLLEEQWKALPSPAIALPLAQLLIARDDYRRATEVLESGLAQAIDRGDKIRMHQARAALEDKQGNVHRAAAERAEAARLAQ